MSERVFLDTNVILYADDRSAGEKRPASLALDFILGRADRQVRHCCRMHTGLE